MEVTAYRSYTHDSTIRLPLGVLTPRFLQSLDRLIEYLEIHRPSDLPRILARVEAMTSGALTDGLPKRAEAVAEKILASCGFAGTYPSLYLATYDLARGLLGIDQELLLSEEPVEVSQRAFIRVRYLPNYLRLRALADVVGRESAIALMKDYLDWAIGLASKHPNPPESLTALREGQVRFNLNEAGMDWISGVIGEHQYVNKVTVCRIQKVLAEYDDPELMDVVACYPDFAMFQNVDENYVLTRTQTLMNGGSCCDTCYHDKRHVEGFEHPPMSLFDGLEAAA